MRLNAALAAGAIGWTAFAAAAADGRPPVRHADPKPSPEALALARAAHDHRTEAAGVEAQIAFLRRRLTALAALEAGGEREVGGKSARLDRLARREQTLEGELGQSRNAVSRLLGVLALYRRDPPPALLVHPASAEAAVRAQILAKAMAPELERRSQALQVQLAQLRRLRADVDAASADLFDAEAALNQQRTALEQMLVDRTTLQRSLLGDAEAEERDLRALARKSGAPKDLIARLPAVAPGLGAAPQDMLAPVQGRLVARFGQSAQKSGPSEGFAWRSLPGAPVLAPASGMIAYSGPLKDYGLILILKTGGAYDLVLTGLGSVGAVSGRTVAAGEPVGRMAEDAGPGPVLYLEVRRGGATIDPARWFKAALRQPPLDGSAH